ncbi:hypothetical protein TMatcc_008521 [Talaromyces marneffei ATCC 18224]|uniref:Uncharacterized protein n=2 Tax=Talaromyces marneffei TaxID=37727 RepID=B6QLS8_TALMQ|nr:uncharacterized protein EYB26_007853 [Talaromyces marneffei]EEA22055.1 hypothetical protein PMAA_058350 [Talaromyces marneffei ATCC 18224]KAE8550484.1 hypothetical protein EYB25_006711 [Talaromyces marneffei]QGA20152.1 hypothetical protein EYB26_007853 [Talaromyces marneffei]
MGRHQIHTGPGLVTPIAGIDLSRCGGNLNNPVRDLEWRASKAQDLNTTYRRKAAKIYTHGAVADLAPCSRCAEAKGPFQKCVIAWDNTGYVSNANCANCYWFHKTSSCDRRYVLPCQALAEEGQDLGGFEDACRIHCHGAHIPDDDGAENEAKSSDEGDEDTDDYTDHHSHSHNDMNEDNDADGNDGDYEMEEEDAASEVDGIKGMDENMPRVNKREVDDDDEYKPPKAKKMC